MTGLVSADRGWTLRTRVAVLCGAVAALLALVAVAAALAATASRSQVETLVDTYAPQRANAEKLLSALVDQETAVRGYAVTGNPADLTPYTSGKATEDKLAASIRHGLSGHPPVLRQLAVVESLAGEWRSGTAEPVIAAVRTQGTAVGQALITDTGRRQFENVRAAVGDLQRQIIALRDAAGRRAKHTSGEVVWLLLAAAVVVVLAGLALAGLLERMVSRPVTALAAEVRRVSRGDYDHEIAGSGPPELNRLATDVDRMRRQIVHDLAELETRAADLVRSNGDLEQFAYVASHDLQEPLRKVASFCQLLKRRYAGQLDERGEQYIAFAVDGAQRMQRLINDLLAFSRIGRVTSGFRDVDLNEAARDAVAGLDSLVERTGAEVTWSDLPVVRGEEALLGNLLANLIGNAVKFRRPDTPPRITLSARREDFEWVITCADNGIGIEPEFADKIFLIFQRLHPREAYPGTGIGLAVAKKIVEYHGGRIWVDAEHTGGAALCFTLPVAAKEPETS
ncbi:MAG: sensor histidine kinase [Mycobacteriales bacterium]